MVLKITGFQSEQTSEAKHLIIDTFYLFGWIFYCFSRDDLLTCITGHLLYPIYCSILALKVICEPWFIGLRGICGLWTNANLLGKPVSIGSQITSTPIKIRKSALVCSRKRLQYVIICPTEKFSN
jgi:hypothetical protein